MIWSLSWLCRLTEGFWFWLTWPISQKRRMRLHKVIRAICQPRSCGCLVVKSGVRRRLLDPTSNVLSLCALSDFLNSSLCRLGANKGLGRTHEAGKAQSNCSSLLISTRAWKNADFVRRNDTIWEIHQLFLHFLGPRSLLWGVLSPGCAWESLGIVTSTNTDASRPRGSGAAGPGQGLHGCKSSTGASQVDNLASRFRDLFRA